jgi:C1A family cysteine protease
VGVFEIKQKVEGDDQGPASRLFVYYCARALQGTESTDSGSTTTTTMRAIVDWGLPPETLWPYDVAQFAVHPPHAVYAAGRPLRPTSAMVVRITQDHDHIVAMMAEQAAISFGFDVPQSFMSQQVAETGVWSGPEANDPIIGGHEVVIVGSNDADGTFLFRNSWGTGWGMAGYGTMPQSFVLSPSCADFIAAVGAPA